MSRWAIILVTLAAVVLVGGGAALRRRVPPPRLELSSLGEAFSGNVALPKEAINAPFQKGKALLDRHVEQATAQRQNANRLEWVAFVLGGLVTMLAGALGVIGDKSAENALAALQTPVGADQPPTKPRLGGRFRVMIVVVGLLSAASSVATAGAHRFREGEAAEFATAKKIQDIANQARRDVQSAKDAKDAQTVLDSMQDAFALLP